ncbi:MAG: replication restart helicase PriA, partial [Chitinophagales bacterium]
ELTSIFVGKDWDEPFLRMKTCFSYAGMVKEIYEKTLEEGDYKPKPILNVLDDEPILTPKQIVFWDWLSEYYMCTEGEVMFNALPSGFRLSSETKLVLNPNFDQDFSLLDDREYLIAEALTNQDEITIGDVQDILELKNVFYIVKSLIEKSVITAKEELQHKYKPKTKTHIRLTEAYKDEDKLGAFFEEISRAYKQQAIIMTYVQLNNESEEGKDLFEKKMILKRAGASSAQMKALVKKGVFEQIEVEVSRLQDGFEGEVLSYELSVHQEEAYVKLKTAFEKKNVALLHGITSSGKTQVYIKIMQEVVAEGRQVLFLMPEIALTSQMIQRLRKVFGGEIGVYHSKFNFQERIEIWQKVLKNEYKVVVGARSSMFLPFADLGLVIVDEEHDHSYKQFDPNPRYHARDASIYLAHLYGAKTILGSATPSIESYYNAAFLKKYALIEMTERFGGVEPPKIVIVNVSEAARQKEMKSHFSSLLLNEVKGVLNKGEQAILFQNRRGYSPYHICNDCSWIPKCHQCDVSLTYHKYANHLKCHYCGYTRKLVSKCDECGSTHLKVKGFGTEKIEDELQLQFPETKIARLDLETARSKYGSERIINSFQEGKVKILVGTQMVTKGLDFDNVSIVGIVSADHLLNFPDFRATERAFQLMLQVSGRAGRRQKQGKVLIQALKPDHPTLGFVLYHDYINFFKSELHDRNRYKYPPYVRMIRLTIKHKDRERVNEAANLLTRYLKEGLPKMILGPTVPPVSRIRLYYLRQVVIKLPKDNKVVYYKEYIHQTIANMRLDKRFKSVVVQTDVDPY